MTTSCLMERFREGSRRRTTGLARSEKRNRSPVVSAGAKGFGSSSSNSAWASMGLRADSIRKAPRGSISRHKKSRFRSGPWAKRDQMR